MVYQDLEPVSKQLTIVIGLTVVGFMAFGLALSFYRNVLFEQTLAGIQEQNERLKQENIDRQSDLEYYNSKQYKDKYAKENLGKLIAGEKLLIITEVPRSFVPDEEEAQRIAQLKQEKFEELLQQMPVIEHWKLYFFDRAGLDRLRKSL